MQSTVASSVAALFSGGSHALPQAMNTRILHFELLGPCVRSPHAEEGRLLLASSESKRSLRQFPRPQNLVFKPMNSSALQLFATIAIL